MKKNVLIAVLVLGMVVALSQFAIAKPGGRGGRDRGAAAWAPDDLNLTTDQLKAIADLRRTAFRENAKVRIEMMKLKLDLELLLTDDKWNETKIKALLKKESDLRAALKFDRLKIAHEIRKLLTDEQQAIWDLSGGRMGKGWANELCDFGGRGGPGGKGRGGMSHPGMMGPGGDFPR